MQSTKHQILVLLKRAGSATVEEAAGALSLASMTARQHLVGLERDGLVLAEKAKGTTGRPHYVFKLTPKGEDMFPPRFDILARLMLEEVGKLDAGEINDLEPGDKQMLLVRRVADRLVEDHRGRVEGRPLADRVALATEVLETIGGFAEWCPTDTGFEIRDYNCVFTRLQLPPQEGCEWHVRLLTSLLEHPVRHELAFNGRVQCCRYLVDPGVSIQKGTV